ncbi:MAG TPA: DinB family protein [Gemmatimonadales bacterium]|nr:DinB family protein [Gemmatimonadales bacterium]
MPSPHIDLFSVFDQAFAGRAWHGTPLWGTLRGLDAAAALRRPAPGRHNIWELVLHCAYWKFVVRQRVTGDAALTFPRAGTNFPELPAAADDAEWKRDRMLLKREHELLREAIAGCTPAMLRRRVGNKRFNAAETVVGIASHDLYHAGQIQLIRRLVG